MQKVIFLTYQISKLHEHFGSITYFCFCKNTPCFCLFDSCGSITTILNGEMILYNIFDYSYDNEYTKSTDFPLIKRIPI